MTDEKKDLTPLAKLIQDGPAQTVEPQTAKNTIELPKIERKSMQT